MQTVKRTATVPTTIAANCGAAEGPSDDPAAEPARAVDDVLPSLATPTAQDSGSCACGRQHRNQSSQLTWVCWAGGLITETRTRAGTLRVFPAPTEPPTVRRMLENGLGAAAILCGAGGARTRDQRIMSPRNVTTPVVAHFIAQQVDWLSRSSGGNCVIRIDSRSFAVNKR